MAHWKALSKGFPTVPEAGSCAGGVSVEWATKGVLESLALSGSDTRVAASAAMVSERRQAGLEPMPSLGCWYLAPESTLRHLWTTQNLRRRSVLGSGVEFTGKGLRCACGAAAMLAHTVSLGVGMLRVLLERAKLLFAIVDLMSVNGTAFRQLRIACETHTGVVNPGILSNRRLHTK
eukprot:scaffold10488_cov121-Isochrysis_galbana.AAC.6